MDQPYSRIADTLLDRQYWSPKDKYDTPYDDTGWSMGDLFGVQVARVTAATILDSSMGRVGGPIAVPQGRSEERRVGTECVSTCRSRWRWYTQKKKKKKKKTNN